MDEYKNKKAVAIKYSSDSDDAPMVIAKGEGQLAREIIEIAKEGIAVHEDREMVNFLSKLNIDQEITSSSL